MKPVKLSAMSSALLMTLSTVGTAAAEPEPHSAAATVPIIGSWDCALANNEAQSPKLLYTFDSNGTGRMTYELDTVKTGSDRLVLKYHAETIYSLSPVVNTFSERITKISIDEYSINGAPLPPSNLELAQSHIERSVVGGMGLFIAAPEQNVVKIGRGENAMHCDRLIEG